jgi:hypothetical protein
MAEERISVPGPKTRMVANAATPADTSTMSGLTGGTSLLPSLGGTKALLGLSD